MKLNVNVPNSMHVAAMTQPWEHQLVGDDILTAMRLIDELGYHKCMLGEHFVVPKAHLELSGDHYFHTTVALGYIGGATRSLRLSSSVSLLPLQSPLVHAKAWSTLDWLTGGRAEAMFGVGWLKEEFDMLGVPFDKRGRMADEYLAAIIQLWTQDDPVFDGEFVSFKEVGFAPKPVQQPRLPIWLGGDAEPVLKRVAKFADGWSPFRTPPEKFPESIDFIRSQPDFDGRPIGIFFALAMLNVGSHHEIIGDERASAAGSAAETIDQIGWLERLGVTETFLPIPADVNSLEAYLDHLRWVAQEIMPKI